MNPAFNAAQLRSFLPLFFRSARRVGNVNSWLARGALIRLPSELFIADEQVANSYTVDGHTLRSYQCSPLVYEDDIGRDR